MEEKIIPGNCGNDCPYNGEGEAECCCDECEFLICCLDENVDDCKTCDILCPRRELGI